jgi:hypothetical protein
VTYKEYVEQMHSYAERMANLLDDIVDGDDPEGFRAMMAEAIELVDDWRDWSTKHGVLA